MMVWALVPVSSLWMDLHQDIPTTWEGPEHTSIKVGDLRVPLTGWGCEQRVVDFYNF